MCSMLTDGNLSFHSFFLFHLSKQFYAVMIIDCATKLVRHILHTPYTLYSIESVIFSSTPNSIYALILTPHIKCMYTLLYQHLN